MTTVSQILARVEITYTGAGTIEVSDLNGKLLKLRNECDQYQWERLVGKVNQAYDEWNDSFGEVAVLRAKARAQNMDLESYIDENNDTMYTQFAEDLFDELREYEPQACISFNKCIDIAIEVMTGYRIEQAESADPGYVLAP